MHDKMMKMLAKKRDLSPREKHAKMDVVKQLKDTASDMMGEKMDGLKKVSVMSDSKEGLEHGLDKAKEVVSDPEMLAMRKHAENPYGDYKSAMDEHENDEDNMEHMSEGGMPEMDAVGSQQARQDISDSFKKALGHAEGGEIESEEDEESPEMEANEEHDEDDGDHEEHEMSEDDLDEQIERLMALKKKMDSRKS